MAKILVTPVATSGVDPFEVEGNKLTYVDYADDGRIYYIDGRSFPERIVTVLEGPIIERSEK